MPTPEHRLGRFTSVYRQPAPPVTVIAGDRRPREEYELDQLLARLGRTASGRTDFSAMSDAEFARLDALYRRYTGEPLDVA